MSEIQWEKVLQAEKINGFLAYGGIRSISEISSFHLLWMSYADKWIGVSGLVAEINALSPRDTFYAISSDKIHIGFYITKFLMTDGNLMKFCIRIQLTFSEWFGQWNL